MGASSKEDVEWFSALPAIGSCLLIDSRFSSRRAFLNSLNNTKLFLNVIEADSVEDARERLVGGWFDACLVGSSIKRDTCEKFLSTAHSIGHSKRCAFMVFTNSRERTSEEVLKWAHRVCHVPGSTLELAEALVVAVLSANTQSVWKDVVVAIRPDLAQEALAASKLKHQLLASAKDGSITGPAREFSVDSIMTQTYSVLDKLIEEYSGKQGALGQDGSVSYEAIRDVRRATDVLFEGFITTTELASYKKYFATTLLEALIRVSLEGREEAVKEFRKSILRKV